MERGAERPIKQSSVEDYHPSTVPPAVYTLLHNLPSRRSRIRAGLLPACPNAPAHSVIPATVHARLVRTSYPPPLVQSLPLLLSDTSWTTSRHYRRVVRAVRSHVPSRPTLPFLPRESLFSGTSTLSSIADSTLPPWLGVWSTLSLPVRVSPNQRSRNCIVDTGRFLRPLVC